MPSPSASQPPSNLDLLRLFRRCAHLQHPGGPSHGRNRILVTLLKHGPLTQRALADLIERTPATLSQQLEPLECARLVERSPLPADRRTVEVRLTEAGAQAAREAQVERQRAADELFGSLGDADRRDLARILGELASSWEARGASR